MSDSSAADRGRSASGKRLLVEDPSGRRPFMRGIMVHSLMSRGVSFQEAYRIANEIRDRLRAREVVTRNELAAGVAELIEEFDLAEAPAAPVAIRVTRGGGQGAPFSKGFLSQSLLAAAIDPNDAFDVAREIEAQLLLRSVREIDRHDLRRLAYEALHERLGPEVADRYLIWRRYQRPERPVIILLGGTSGVGKTSLALEVAHRLGIPRVLSTDAIRQVMRIMLSRELAPAIHASSYDAHTVLPAVDDVSDPVIEGFRAQSSTISVGVRAMLDRAIAENESLVLDGVSIVPGGIDLSAYADRAEVIFLLVALLDPDKFASRFASRGESAQLRPPHRYLENLDAIEKIQNHLLELADQHDVPIVENDSFDRSVISIIRHVAEALRKKEKFDVANLF